MQFPRRDLFSLAETVPINALAPLRLVKTHMILATIPMFAAAGWSLLYLILGGGIGGAILIFVVLKLLGR